ncbi:MAG TPA: NAD(P)-dependent oxidoreductase [Acidocella sp.]|nr:NAD(P)-dependent oxidoreductase [Acidocella sp.]
MIMIPLVINPDKVRIGLAGAGAAAARRLAALRAAGTEPVLFTNDSELTAGADALPCPPDAASLAGLQLLYIAGLEARDYLPLAQAARAAKVLVNVEDVPEQCDFHAVAEVRRGDLLLTISTGGAAPGLAGVIRQALERCFAPEWAGRVAEVAALRRHWREEGLPMAEAARRIAALVRERCWLSCPAME